MGYVSGHRQQPSDQPPMGTAVRPAKTSPASWDAFSDVDAVVDEVLSELAAMAANGARPLRPGPKPPLAGAALRKAIMAMWCTCFCGMPWRAIGQLSGISFGTLFSLFARWTRLGLWRMACGDTPDPSTVVIDSRSCSSAPSCFDRGVDGVTLGQCQAATSNSDLTKAAWATMSSPPIPFTCPFLIIARVS
jgi:hypothetical protein